MFFLLSCSPSFFSSRIFSPLSIPDKLLSYFLSRAKMKSSAVKVLKIAGLNLEWILVNFLSHIKNPKSISQKKSDFIPSSVILLTILLGKCISCFSSCLISPTGWYFTHYKNDEIVLWPERKSTVLVAMSTLYPGQFALTVEGRLKWTWHWLVGSIIWLFHQSIIYHLNVEVNYLQ